MKKTITHFALLAIFALTANLTFAQCGEIFGSGSEETATSGTVNIMWYSDNSNVSYTLEYGLNGFLPGEGITVSGSKLGNEGLATISGLLPNTLYQYYLQEDCGTSQSLLAGPFGFITDKACRQAQYFQVQPGATFVNVNWDSFNSGATYHLSYGQGNDPTQPGTLMSGLSAVDNIVRIEGLQPLTEYWFKITEECTGGEMSNELWTVTQTSSSCEAPYSVYPNERGRDFLKIYWYSQNFSNENIASQGGYSIEYGLQGFTPGTGTTQTGTFTSPYIEALISGLQMATSYDIYVTEICDMGNSIAAGPFTIATLEACATSDNFHPQNKAIGVVELNIQSYNPGASYQIEYGAPGFVSGEGTVLTGTFSTTESYNEITISNLTPSTEYEFRLIENCVEGGSTNEKSAFITTLDPCPAPQYLYASNQAVGLIEVNYQTFIPGSVYTIEYGLVGFTSGQGTTITGTSTDQYVEVIISGLQASTTYEIRVTEACPNNETTPVVSTQITTVEPCPAAFEVNLAYADSYDIGFSWDSYNIGQTFAIEYGVTGFQPGTGTVIQGTLKDNNDMIVSGLTPETTYDMYITENCANGETSTAGPFSATTTVAVSAPANDACANAVLVTAGTTTPNAYPGTNLGATGEDKPAICSFDGGVFSKGVWYKYSSTNTTPVNFNLCTGASNFDTQMEIYTGTCQALTCLKGEDDDGECLSNDPNITVAPQAGTDYFIYISGDNGEKGNFELHVQEDPSYAPCVTPTGAAVNNVTHNSAGLSWTSANAGSWYAAVIGYAGFNPYTEQGVVDTDGILAESNSITLYGLNAETNYDLYLYEECTNGEYSLTGPLSFITTTVTSTVKSNSTNGYVIFNGETVKLVNFQDLNVEEIAVYNLSGLSVPFNLAGDEITLRNASSGMYLVTIRDQHDKIHYAKILVK